MKLAIFICYREFLASTAGGMGQIPDEGTNIPHSETRKKEKNVTGTSLSRQGKVTIYKQENYEKKNLHGKGKHVVKAVDKPLIKLLSKLKDKSTKTPIQTTSEETYKAKQKSKIPC